MYNSPHKQKVLEALEFAEQMALCTPFDDKKLHKSLFDLGNLYKELCDGIRVSEKKINVILETFYKIDPEMIELMKNRPPNANIKIA